jgi:hypothetical protein
VQNFEWHCHIGQEWATLSRFARRANPRPATRLVVDPVQFVGADAALVQQREGGTEVGRGHEALCVRSFRQCKSRAGFNVGGEVVRVIYARAGLGG